MTTPSTRLRIAVIADPTEPHVKQWIGFMRGRSHEVRIIVTADTAARMPDPCDAGVDRLPVARTSVPTPMRYLMIRREVQRLTLQADIVHAQYLTTNGWLAAVSGRPYAVTTWGSDIYLDIRRSPRNRLFGWAALRGASLVTADSEHLAAATVRAGARSDRVRVLQFGVDLHRFTPGLASAELRAQLGLIGKRVVFSARSPAPLYRHELVLRALALLPRDVVMVMSEHRAAPGYVAKLGALADRLGVRDRLRVIPAVPHDDMPAMLRLADVVVSVPRTDATPLTALEAMACGRPVVAGGLPSLREWADAFRPELLVDRPAPESIAQAVRRALDSPPQAASDAASAALAIVRRRGDQEANMLALEQHYLDIRQARSVAARTA